VSDEDGIVVVPRDRLEATVAAAERLRRVEIKIQREIERGKDLAALLRYDEVIESKTATGGLPQMRFSGK
jgi:regulator of RNase E activity RraA